MKKINFKIGRKRIILAIAIFCPALMVGLWLWSNPAGLFGFHGYALTVYNRIPFPVLDVVISVDGSLNFRESKSHRISTEEFEALIGTDKDSWPEVVVLGIGYSQQVQVDEAILGRRYPKAEVLPTSQAVRRFNQLRKEARRVSAIIHSTC